MSDKKTLGSVVALFLVVVLGLGYWVVNTVRTPAANPAGQTHLSGLSVGEDGLTVSGATSLSGTLSTTGTTSTSFSYDGFVDYGAYTVATGTAKAVFTNSRSPMACQSGAVYAKNNGSFSPSIVIGLGTSTSATGYSVNLLASTTVATSTTTLIPLLGSYFILGNGESIVGAISDPANHSMASSTYFSRWSVQFGVRCWAIGG